MSKYRCCKLIRLAILSSFILSSSAVALEKSKGPLSCDFSATESPMVTVKITNGDIKDAVLKMPRDYVISAGFGDNSTRKALLLRAYDNSFKPYPNRELHLENGQYKGAVGINDQVNILISSHWPMEKLARDSVSFSYGLKFGDPSLDIEGELSQFNLYKMKYKINPVYQKVVFLGKENKEITDVIRCSQDNNSAGSPQCSHLFEAGAYDVQINYAKSQLSQWQELRDGTAKLLQCFTAQEPIQIEGK